MSIAPRDAEAFDLASKCSYAGAFVTSLSIEMQTRRLTLGVYGELHGTRTTSLVTLTFFGTGGIELTNDDDAFPQSVRVASFELKYDDEDGIGHATLRGVRGWSVSWSFDGLAYEERAALVASLADDDSDDD